MTQCVDQLLPQRQSDADRHALLESVRNPSDNSDVNIFPKCSGSVIIPVHFRGLIKTVTSELDQVAEFEPLVLKVYLSNILK